MMVRLEVDNVRKFEGQVPDSWFDGGTEVAVRLHPAGAPVEQWGSSSIVVRLTPEGVIRVG